METKNQKNINEFTAMLGFNVGLLMIGINLIIQIAQGEFTMANKIIYGLGSIIILVSILIGLNKINA